MVALLELREYEGTDGRSRFGEWFKGLNNQAALKVRAALARLEAGHTSNTKLLKATGGVWEYTIDFGPGYRVYFGQDGKQLIILLVGGKKKSQTTDVENASENWQEYKTRKKKGG